MTASDPAVFDSLLAAARQQAERGDVAAAVQSYRRVLDASAGTVEALTFLGHHALSGGRFADAMPLLERAVAGNGDDVQLLKAYGMACMGAGSLDAARGAFERALAIAPEFFVARLHLGNVLEMHGDHAAALREYFAAINQAQAKGRWLSPETTAPALHGLVTHAMRFVDAGRKQLFSAVIAPLRAEHGVAALRRVERALEIYLGEIAPNWQSPHQRPKFLYVPDLPTTPYFARELFGWYEELESNTDVIRAELRDVLQREQGIEPFLTFPSPDAVPQFLGAGPQGPPAWDAFFFYRHGERYEENCARCPRTVTILESLPLARIRAHAPEVCFSVLAPGTHILPHHGVTNARLVTHLPLIVPDNCAIKVGGEEHAWREGRCITFDDTFEHEAWNRSEQTRVVLILDIWNPHLTAVERDALTALIIAIGDFNRDCGVAG